MASRMRLTGIYNLDRGYKVPTYKYCEHCNSKLLNAPTKFKPEFHEQIYEIMKTGKSISQTAEIMGLHRDSFYEWEKSVPGWSESFDRARQAAEAHWENQLEIYAKDPSFRSSAAGKLLEFSMQARFRDVYGKNAKQEVEVSYKTMSTEDLDKQIKALTDKMSIDDLTDADTLQ